MKPIVVMCWLPVDYQSPSPPHCRHRQCQAYVQRKHIKALSFSLQCSLMAACPLVTSRFWRQQACPLLSRQSAVCTDAQNASVPPVYRFVQRRHASHCAVPAASTRGFYSGLTLPRRTSTVAKPLAGEKELHVKTALELRLLPKFHLLASQQRSTARDPGAAEACGRLN